MGVLYSHIQKWHEKRPNHPALILEDRIYSYDDLFKASQKWRRILERAPLSSAVRVVILSEDQFHLLALSLCLAQLNATLIPLNCQLTKAQIQTVLNTSKASHVIYDPALKNRLNALETPDITLIDRATYEEEVCADYPFEGGVQDNPDFLITFSSGSTGDPKPIMISQAKKCARAQQSIDLYDLDETDVILNASPFFHSLGQRLSFVALCSGATLVHLPKFTPSLWIDAVESHRVSFIIAVASHLSALKEDLFHYSKRLRSLKTLVASSAPMDGTFKDRLFQAVGCAFHEIYGASEIAIATNLFPRDAKAKYKTVGVPCKGVELAILNDAYTPCPEGEIGEIAVRSPLVFSGYYGRPDLTQDSFHQDYFLSGDLGFIDQDGFLHYVARKKDIIISGGINIYPGDIEHALLKEPDLDDIAVIGVEDDLLGEVIVCVCVAPNGSKLERALRKRANQSLAPFQRPLKYFFVNELALGPTGKIDKPTLRKTYAPLNTDWTLALRLMTYGSSEKTKP